LHQEILGKLYICRSQFELGRGHPVVVKMSRVMTKRRNLIYSGVGIAMVVLLLAFFTNPNQAAHLKAIKDTAVLRRSGYEALRVEVSPLVIYNNYLIFSTTSLAGMKTLTYGYFGQVQTTNDAGLATY